MDEYDSMKMQYEALKAKEIAKHCSDKDNRIAALETELAEARKDGDRCRGTLRSVHGRWLTRPPLADSVEHAEYLHGILKLIEAELLTKPRQEGL